MSFQAMAWAIVQKPKGAKEKFVLLMLANYASNEDGRCFPSVAKIAEETMMSRDSVIRAIKSLEEDGFLAVKRRSAEGVNLPNYYTLNVQGVVAHSGEGSSTQLLGVVAHSNHNLSSKPIIEPKSRSSREEEFAEWYSIYPNKVGKAAAERAFASARKRSSFEEILTGLRRYVSKRDDRPWCNPATWLNQDRWHDQPATNGQPPPQQIDWAKRMEVYERSGTWAPGWGPKPGEIGCKAPKNGVLNYVNG